MADDPTEALPVVKVELASARWTVSQFNERFAALTPVRARRVDGVDRGEAKILHDDMGEAIRERDRALQSATDGGARLKSDRAHLRTVLRERDEQIARMRGEDPGMGGLPTRAISEVMGVTRHGEQGAEVILADARRKAGVIVADARRLEARAQDLLARAETSAVAPAPELVLPPEPHPTGDVPADLEAQAAHLRACRDAIEEHRFALEACEAERQAELERQCRALEELRGDVADQETALGERQAGFVAELGRIGAATERLVVDLTDGSAGDGATQATQAMEVA